MTAVRLTEGPDLGGVWHYGDPLREQRLLAAGDAGVDLSHRPVFVVRGRDRLTWLNAICTQQFDGLAPGAWTTSYILDAHGHVGHVFGGVDDGEAFWATSEPGHEGPLLAWLRRMVFAARVEIAEVSETHRLGIAPGRGPVIVPREELDEAIGDVRAGVWAAEALRIAAGVPRAFVDTDEKTIPNELATPEGVTLGPAVHLKKGCYPGQETVARIYNLGRPPRRLVLLHLDGTANSLPTVGAELSLDGRVVGRVGSSERHYELGPIALGLVKRGIPVDAELAADGIAAGQEALVDPEVGLHVRARLG